MSQFQLVQKLTFTHYYANEKICDRVCRQANTSKFRTQRPIVYYNNHAHRLLPFGNHNKGVEKAKVYFTATIKKHGYYIFRGFYPEKLMGKRKNIH